MTSIASTRARRWAAAGAALLAVACAERVTPPASDLHAPVTVTATLTPAQQALVAGMSVEVTGPGITTPIIATLNVAGATVNGTVQVPVGASRTFTVRAFDAQGTETHEGSATAAVVAGTNPPLTVRMAAREGSVPIDVTVGTYGVTLAPATASVPVGSEVTLTANVTSNGSTVPGALTWGVVNPALVTLTVAGDGRSAVVRGRLAGTTRVVASYQGVAAASTVTITDPPAGNQPPVANANGPYASTPGNAIAFSSAGSTDADGSIVAYAWTFGDGTTSTQANPSKSYSAVGTYVATLTVTDDDGATATATTAVAVSALPTGSFAATRLSAGLDFTCALTSASAASCWGANASGQLGNGTTTPSVVPVAVSLPGGITYSNLRSGALHTCVNGSDGNVYCWGGNAYGQLGLGDTVTRTRPVAVPATMKPGASTMGYYRSCNSDGTTYYCWGRSGSSSSYSLTRVAYPAPSGSTFYTVTPGGYQTCRYVQATVQGSVQKVIDCTDIGFTVTIPQGVTLGALSVADGYACNTYASQGGMQCWGSNAYGQWGTGSTGSGGPVTLSGYVLSWLGGTFTCGSYNGPRACAGSNSYGELGNGTTSPYEATPTPIVGGANLIDLALGVNHACGIRSGFVHCWGRNDAGQLGDGSTTNRSVPTPVVGSVTPNQPPTVVAQGPFSARVNESVTFTAQGSDPDGSVVAYEWAVVTGASTIQTATTAAGSLTRSFGGPGTYSVYVAAVDNLGARSQTQTITVLVTQ